MCHYGGQRETPWVPKLQTKGKSQDKDIAPTDRAKILETQKGRAIGEDEGSGNSREESPCSGQRVGRDTCEQDPLITATERSSSEKQLPEKDELLFTVAFSQELRQCRKVPCRNQSPHQPLHRAQAQ